MSSTTSLSLRDLARVLPRTADLAFEARRHASLCERNIERATHAMEHLRTLLGQRVPSDLDHGRLLDVDAHLRVLEQKVHLYAAICATVDSTLDALGLARRALDRLGASSTRIMKVLRGLRAGAEATMCRNVANELVQAYTRNTDRCSDLHIALTEALPADFAARLSRVC